MARPLTLAARVARKLPRIRKAARRWVQVLATGRRPATRLCLVVGSQRSGTRLPLLVLDQSADVMTYSEGTSPYFDDVLLVPVARLQQLLARSAFPVVALKPICETHRVTELLDTFPRSRAIWIFRHYEAAVASASAKWTSAPEAVRRLAHGELAAAGWRAGGLSEDRLALVRRLYRHDMSIPDANAVMWYLRNQLFFDLRAHTRQEILLVSYEDLVKNELQQAQRIFACVGVDMPSRYSPTAYDTSCRGRRPLALRGDVAELCAQLYEDLHACYLAALSPIPGRPA
jgi:hypothetical protein